MSKEYQRLIKRCIRQDVRAQHELYSRFAPQLLAVCYRYARHNDEAEDILQEAFIKIFQKLKRYNFKGSFEGWLRRLTVNTAIDHLRKHKYQMQETDLEGSSAEGMPDDMIDQLDLEDLYAIIQELPTGYRLVFNMYAIEGYSHKEIGEKLGITASTSRSQYTRARMILQEQVRAIYTSETTVS